MSIPLDQLGPLARTVGQLVNFTAREDPFQRPPAPPTPLATVTAPAAAAVSRDSVFTRWLKNITPDPVERWTQRDALPFVSRVLETSGFGPALYVADAAVRETVREPLATAFIMSGANKRGQGLSFREAEALAEQVSVGQAALYNVAGEPGAQLLADKFGQQPFLGPSFDIRDEKQRAEVFTQHLGGQVGSGLLDLIVDPLAFIPVGKATSAGRVAARLQRPTVTAAALEGLQREAVQYVQKVNNQVPLSARPYSTLNEAERELMATQLQQVRLTTGTDVRLHKILTETDPARLLDDPMLGDPTLAPLAAATRTPQEAALLALSVKGDVQAARALDQLAPSVARSSPVPLPPPTPGDITRVFDDLVQRDPGLADTVSKFSERASVGAAITPGAYMPSPQAFIERGRMYGEKVRTERLLGGGVKGVAEVMAGPRVRYLAIPAAWAVARLRPLGYASLNNPRPFELQNEVSSFFSQSKVIRGMLNDPDQAVQQQARGLYERTLTELASATTEVARAAAVRNAEQNAANLIAAREIKRLNSNVDVSTAVRDAVKEMQKKRDLLVDELRTTGVAFEQNGGPQLKTNTNLQTKLVSTVPMLDINVLERNIRRTLEQNTGASQAAEFTAGLFENLNLAFSSAVLIRPGYIPKNSVFEPALRTFLTTSTLPFTLLPAALLNVARNSSSRLRGVNYLLAGRNPVTRRIREQQTRELREQLDALVVLRDTAVGNRDRLQRELDLNEERLQKLEGNDYVPEPKRVARLETLQQQYQRRVDVLTTKLDDAQKLVDQRIAEKAALDGRTFRTASAETNARNNATERLRVALSARDRVQDQFNNARMRLTSTETRLQQEVDPVYGMARVRWEIEKIEGLVFQANRTLAQYEPQIRQINPLREQISERGLGTPQARASEAMAERYSWETAEDSGLTYMTSQGLSKPVPNIWAMPGGRADLAEISPIKSATSLITSATLNRVSQRQRILRTTDQPIRKGSKEWWDAYASTVDKYRVNDPVFSRLIQGQSHDEIMEFLMADLRLNGNESTMMRLAVEEELRKGNEIMVVTPRLDELDESWARSIIDDAEQQVNALVPDDVVRQRLATGPLTAKQWQEVWRAQLGGSTVAEIPAGRLPELPTTPYALVSPSFMQGLLNVYSNIVDTGFRLITQPEYVGFRSPFLKRVGDKTMMDMLNNARLNNIDVTQEVMSRYAQTARRTAILAADNTFYNVRRMNNAQYMSRFLLGFPNAMYNSARFYAMSAIDNPYTLVLLNDIREAPYDIGMVVDEENNPVTVEQSDRQDKETYLVLPFPLQTNAPGFRGKLNTRQFDFITQGPSPSWLATIPLSLAVSRFPTLEQTLTDTLGKRIYGTLLFAGQPQLTAGQSATGLLNNYFKNNVAPSWLVDGLQLAYANVAKDKVLGASDGELGRIANTTWAIHAARLHSFAVDNPDKVQPEDGEAFLRESLDLALSFERTRWLTRFLSPLGVTWEPSSQIVKDYRIAREAYYRQNPDQLGTMDIDDAVLADMITMWGGTEEGYTAFLSSGRTSELGVQPTQLAFQRLQANRDLIVNTLQINPSEATADSVGIITDTVIPGEFSPAVYSHLETLELGGISFPSLRKSVRDRQAEVNVRNGWLAYNRITARTDAILLGRRSKSLLSKENRDLWLSQKKEVEALKAVNPAWGDEFGQSTVKIRPNLRMIGAAVNDERFMNAQKGPDLVKWEGIAEWYELYTEVKIAYDQLPPNTPQRTALRDWWATETVRLRAGNTYFADFHSRYLQGDEVINVSQLMEEDLPVVSPSVQIPSQMDVVAEFDRRLLGVR